MESPLSQISSRTPLEGIGCLSRPEMDVRASKVGCPSEIVQSCVTPNSEGHNSLVRIPILVFLDFMESPLSQLSSRTPLEGIGCLSRP